MSRKIDVIVGHCFCSVKFMKELLGEHTWISIGEAFRKLKP
jgi:hypothetical protein